MDQSGDLRRSLVVCPSTVVGHWVGEIRRFFPRSQVLSPFDFTGPVKVRRQAWDKEGHKHNIVVTSYSVLRADVDLLEKTIWDYCVLDEGHLLKNPKTGKHLHGMVPLCIIYRDASAEMNHFL
jgi:TATA-binding protein-associated factor